MVQLSSAEDQSMQQEAQRRFAAADAPDAALGVAPKRRRLRPLVELPLEETRDLMGFNRDLGFINNHYPYNGI